MKKGMYEEDRPIPFDYYMAYSVSAIFNTDPQRFYEKKEVNQIGKFALAIKDKKAELASKIPWK